MKLHIKRIVTLLLALAMMCSIPVISLAAKNVDSGNDGKKITWVLDSKGTLTISGEGKLKKSFSERQDIKKIIIEDGITEIDDGVFYHCINLKSVKIPDSVKRIGRCAFERCGNLTDLSLGKGVEEIDDCAFDSTEIRSVELPDSLKRIGIQSFSHSDIESIKIPDSVTELGSYAFNECCDLVTVEIGDGIKEIKECTFMWCISLKNLTLGSNVRKFEVGAFHGCRKLKSVVIPKCTKTIGIRAFGYDDDFSDEAVEPFVKVPGFRIYGYKGTASEKYAKENGFKFTDITTKATLSATSFTYNGTTQKPVVTIKNAEGKKLVEGRDYTVKYPSKSKDVGKYTVTVTLKGKYIGTKKLTYPIRPKSTSISKLTAGEKQFKAQWYKRSTQTTGYQIQYGTSSDMSNAKSLRMNKNTSTSKTFTGLKSNTTYYVRIRTYKTVTSNGKNVRIYSSWSNVKVK